MGSVLDPLGRAICMFAAFGCSCSLFVWRSVSDAPARPFPLGSRSARFRSPLVRVRCNLAIVFVLGQCLLFIEAD